MKVFGIVEVLNVDFRTSGSGEWQDFRIWEYLTGGNWVGSKEGEIPHASNDVFIQKGHLVTLKKDQACNGIRFNDSIGKLDTGVFELNVNDDFQMFSGIAPGSVSTTASESFIIGKIKLIGSDRTVTSVSSWNNTVNFGGFDLEVDVTGTLTISIMRSANFTLTDGTVIHGTANLWIIEKICNIKAAGIFDDSQGLGFRFDGSTAFQLFNCQGELRYDLQSGYEIDADSHNIQFLKLNRSGAQNLPIVPNGLDVKKAEKLQIQGGGAKTLVNNMTVGHIIVQDATTISLGGFTLGFDEGKVEYIGTVARSVSANEWPVEINIPEDAIFDNTGTITIADSPRFNVGTVTVKEPLDQAVFSIMSRFITSNEPDLRVTGPETTRTHLADIRTDGANNIRTPG